MRRSPGNPPRSRAGFSLVEILAAMAVLSLVMLILVGLSDQMSRVWTKGLSQNQHRNRARSALTFMGRELRQAIVSPDTSDTALQLVINPTSVTLNFPHSIFWQAPVATDSSSGNIAEVGYFIRRDGNRANLCRMLVNPTDTNYLIYDASNPDKWVSDSVLDLVAPATKVSQYRGLFLENVLGLWVQAYNKDGTAYFGNSRKTSPVNQLPACIKISLVFLDETSAKRVSSPVPLASATDTPETFINTLPAAIKGGASIATFTVALKNYR